MKISWQILAAALALLFLTIVPDVCADNVPVKFGMTFEMRRLIPAMDSRVRLLEKGRASTSSRLTSSGGTRGRDDGQRRRRCLPMTIPLRAFVSTAGGAPVNASRWKGAAFAMACLSCRRCPGVRGSIADLRGEARRLVGLSLSASRLAFARQVAPFGIDAPTKDPGDHCRRGQEPERMPVSAPARWLPRHLAEYRTKLERLGFDMLADLPPSTFRRKQHRSSRR